MLHLGNYSQDINTGFLEIPPADFQNHFHTGFVRVGGGGLDNFVASLFPVNCRTAKSFSLDFLAFAALSADMAFDDDGTDSRAGCTLDACTCFQLSMEVALMESGTDSEVLIEYFFKKSSI